MYLPKYQSYSVFSMFLPLSTLLCLINSKISRTYTYTMKLSKQQLKTSTRYYIKKCAGAVCTSKLHESARNSNIYEVSESGDRRLSRVHLTVDNRVETRLVYNS